MVMESSYANSGGKRMRAAARAQLSLKRCSAADAARKSENLSLSPLRNGSLSNDVCLSESSILWSKGALLVAIAI